METGKHPVFPVSPPKEKPPSEPIQFIFIPAIKWRQMTANNEIKLKYTLTPRRVNDNQRLNNGLPPNSIREWGDWNGFECQNSHFYCRLTAERRVPTVDDRKSPRKLQELRVAALIKSWPLKCPLKWTSFSHVPTLWLPGKVEKRENGRSVKLNKLSASKTELLRGKRKRGIKGKWWRRMKLWKDTLHPQKSHWVVYRNRWKNWIFVE